MIANITEGKITGLLGQWDDGDPDALDRLLGLVLDDLRRLARFHLVKQRPDHTLEPGALVNEMYLKLTAGERVPTFKDRTHFFSFASRLMRLILIDYARARGSRKRRGAHEHISLENAELIVGSPFRFDLVALREALDELEEQAPRHHHIVQLRFLLGLGLEDIAQWLGTSPSTVSREWATAKAWLYARLADGSPAKLAKDD